MSITSITTDFAGQVGVKPRLVRLLCDDDYATVIASGYLNGAAGMGASLEPTDFIFTCYEGGFGSFNPVFSGSNVTLVPTPDNGGVSGSFIIGHLTMAQDATGTIEDAGFAASSVILNSVAGGQSIAAATASATPGTIRSLRGLITGTNATMTTGNLVGLRGEVDCVGASGGFLYGTQGKVIPTGTLSGSVWVAGLFGQFDVSAATVNAAQLAAVWGDWGTTGATATNLTGCRGFAFTNTTSNVINAQDYRYGNATYLQELAGAGGTLNYYADSGTSAGSAGDAAHCAAQKVIKILVNGTAAYIPVFTQNT